ncbi:hypothetical protein AC1031_018189 [Aphanomyces cochlioides]|nr:hypothetical protein AC1031_018189 [Aphanomyces cochlioides]
MDSEREGLPLPETIRCQLTVKVVKPLGKSRIIVGQPTILYLQRGDSFGVARAMLSNAANVLVDQHHSDEKNAKCIWDPSTLKDVYIKCAANTTQDKYTLLNMENYMETLARVWENARNSRNAQASFLLHVFMYIEKCSENIGIRRATQHNIASSAARLADYVRENSVVLGPLQTHYASVVAARLPASEPINIPDNATMRQLGHIDQIALNHEEDRRQEINRESEPYRRVRIRLGSMTSVPIDCFILVEDMRRSLGLPQYELAPVYRSPMRGLSCPSHNIDDRDHANEQS